jgi:hypothetical protein
LIAKENPKQIARSEERKLFTLRVELTTMHTEGLSTCSWSQVLPFDVIPFRALTIVMVDGLLDAVK